MLWDVFPRRQGGGVRLCVPSGEGGDNGGRLKCRPLTSSLLFLLCCAGFRADLALKNSEGELAVWLKPPSRIVRAPGQAGTPNPHHEK